MSPSMQQYLFRITPSVPHPIIDVKTLRSIVCPLDSFLPYVFLPPSKPIGILKRTIVRSFPKKIELTPIVRNIVLPKRTPISLRPCTSSELSTLSFKRCSLCPKLEPTASCSTYPGAAEKVKAARQQRKCLKCFSTRPHICKRQHVPCNICKSTRHHTSLCSEPMLQEA